jgi:hypothetical protein
MRREPATSARGESQANQGASAGPPPLQPFGLVLHHDGSWTHQGHPIGNRKIREKFDRSVRYLPEEGKYVVQVGRFRGEIEVEEAGFFVRDVDLDRGEVLLSDGSRDSLDLDSMRVSALDGAFLCTVKRALVPGGLPARCTHAAQAELLDAVDESTEGPVIRLEGRLRPMSPLYRAGARPLELPRGRGLGRTLPGRSSRSRALTCSLWGAVAKWLRRRSANLATRAEKR